ncbi:S8 family peptidase [Amycolatopsis sp.]|uniref:S8 family peptidase n=1 Tax=Amycolatopsis sp. TaxID=37632 RepID=UPI002B7A338D|nr:S8 family peptidase [Amycolatopsis sp.]HVV09765.1 S8 family peptidase [Amycolatopsis sp.]
MSQENPPNWGLDRIDQRDGATDHLYRYDTTAADVTVYVIDTGVDAKQPDFEGRVEPGKNFVEGNDDASDGNGDGTRLASIVGGKDYGVAKGVHIVPVRVLDDNGSGDLTNIVSGLDWVAKNAKQPAVAVLGIGGPANDQLDAAVRALTAVMPVAVPAGWSAVDAANSSPGRVAEALTVGAVDAENKIAAKSNFGAAVDVFAPGVDVVSATNTSPSAASGANMAAAFVGGAAALYRSEHPSATPAEITQGIVTNATQNVLTGLPDGTANRLLCTVSGD